MARPAFRRHPNAPIGRPMMPSRQRPKYQVFISSTFEDLHQARVAVTWAVMKQRLIPVGMEAFPAADDRGWKIITRVIDQSDYYVLLLAGRYGSVDLETGLSWTEREYEYALSRQVPVLAFCRDRNEIRVPDQDDDPEKKKKLELFVERVRKRHHVATWREQSDLCEAVQSALSNSTKDDEDSESPRPGWYRGDSLASHQVLDELARLSAENARLRGQIQLLEAREPKLSLLSSSYTGEDAGTAPSSSLIVHVPVCEPELIISDLRALRDASPDAFAAEYDTSYMSRWKEYMAEIDRLISWLNSSERYFDFLMSQSRSPSTTVTFFIENAGTQPATDVRARFSLPDWLSLPNQKGKPDASIPKLPAVPVGRRPPPFSAAGVAGTSLLGSLGWSRSPSLDYNSFEVSPPETSGVDVDQRELTVWADRVLQDHCVTVENAMRLTPLSAEVPHAPTIEVEHFCCEWPAARVETLPIEIVYVEVRLANASAT